MTNKLKTGLFKALRTVYVSVGGERLRERIPFLAKTYDLLFKYFWPYPEIIEINGSKMYINVLDEDSNMKKTFQAYALNKNHEQATTNVLKKIINKGDLVVDLGANIGYFTLLAARLVGNDGKVYAFEPEPKNFKYLVNNIKLNNYNNVFPVQKAATNKIGKTKLFLCSYDTGHHTINRYNGINADKPKMIKNGKQEFIEIETITLDEFFKNKKVDVIKMDIEGAEMLALIGMDKLIKRNKDIKMVVEFFPLLIEEMGNSSEEFVRKLLVDYGFSMFVIGGDYYGKQLKINSVDELMNLCKDKKNYQVNLLLEK